MTFIRFVTGKKPSGILSDISFGILSGISSGILPGISSGILFGISSGISSDILSGILSGKFSGILSGKHSGTLSLLLFGILSDILFGIPSGILSGISSGILSDILSGISSGKFYLAVEVQRCTLSWAGPRLRSSSAHWAGQVPGWGPAVHTELGSWQRAWRRESAKRVGKELGEELARRKCRWKLMQTWSRRNWRRRRGGGRGGRGLRWRKSALIKSNNPHLAGGEQTNKNKPTLGKIKVFYFILIMFIYSYFILCSFFLKILPVGLFFGDSVCDCDFWCLILFFFLG